MSSRKKHKGTSPQEKAPTSEKKAPVPGQAPVPVEKVPAPEERDPAPETMSPAPEEEAPTPEDKAPVPEEEAPTPEGKAPVPEEEAPASEEKAPIPEEKAPASEKKAPAAEAKASAAAERPARQPAGRPDYRKPRFTAASSPHIYSGESVRSAMLDVMIALVPALGVSTYFFGPRALLMVLVCMVSCVVFEALYRLLMRKYQSVGDLSACVTGMLLAMCLPVNAPYWMAVVGCFFAIVIVKQLYGGLGKNFMNPALAARVFLFSFPALMNTWVSAGTDFWSGLGNAADAVTSATPMASLHQGILPSLTVEQMLAGAHGGSMGETASAALIIGGLYLLLRRVIPLRIPLFYLGTVAALTYLFPQGGNDPLDWMLSNLLCGGVLLGAIFMATDYTTSPVTPRGQTLYALGCGALTVFLRYFGAYPEGVSFAILIMNAFAWLLDKAGKPHRFGTPRLKRRQRGGAEE